MFTTEKLKASTLNRKEKLNLYKRVQKRYQEASEHPPRPTSPHLTIHRTGKH